MNPIVQKMKTAILEYFNDANETAKQLEKMKKELLPDVYQKRAEGYYHDLAIVRNRSKEKISTAAETVDQLLDKILAEGIYGKGDEVAVMVNGMGATPLSELYIANLEVSKVLADKGIIVKKTLVGNFMTSLEMAGFSITLLKLDAELEALLNAPADTPAFTQF